MSVATQDLQPDCVILRHRGVRPSADRALDGPRKWRTTVLSWSSVRGVRGYVQWEALRHPRLQRL